MSAENKLEIEYLDSESTKGMPFSEAVRVGKCFICPGNWERPARWSWIIGTKQTMETIYLWVWLLD
jgi:hypothetical protein